MVETLPWSIPMTPNMFMPSLGTAYSSAAMPIFRSPNVVNQSVEDFRVRYGSVGRRAQRGWDQSELLTCELSRLGKQSEFSHRLAPTFRIVVVCWRPGRPARAKGNLLRRSIVQAARSVKRWP